MDCLEGMKLIDDKSIDMILCDLPYGTTACKWDTVIPFEPLWEQYERVIKDNGAIVLFGQEPFSSNLRSSNFKLYRYDWIWEKDNHTNFLNIKKQPAKRHELISVFYKKQPTYNPQMWEGKENHSVGNQIGKMVEREYLGGKFALKETQKSNLKYPISILRFKGEGRGKAVHPTQKPVALCEYLIKTYTDEDEVVLDNCIGSGTTAIACINTNRNYIGFELSEEYCKIAEKRISETTSNQIELPEIERNVPQGQFEWLDELFGGE
jgi:site-specific DNA-methyltransferase (adenine-specific)